MGAEGAHDITAALRAWRQGDERALESLIPLVDGELRRRAHRFLEAKHHDPILDTTALINEACLRLFHATAVNWRDRAHFFAVCAKIMRSILVDHARACRAAKRGGGRPPLPLNESLAAAPQPLSDLLAIHEALEALAIVDERKGQVVELRFFGGLSVEETAEVLKISPETVRRDWKLAKAWLLRELDGAEAG